MNFSTLRTKSPYARLIATGRMPAGFVAHFPTLQTKTPYERLLETGRMSDDAGFGNIWGDILGQVGGAAVQTFGPLLTGSGTSSGTQARGLQAITAFGNQAIATLNQILQMARTTPPLISIVDALNNAQRIAGTLSDPAFVYQAQSGDDAAALRTFKTQANSIVAQIQALAGIGQTVPVGAIPAANTPAVNVPATILPAGTTPANAAPATGQLVAGIDNKTLLVAGAIAAFLLLK